MLLLLAPDSFQDKATASLQGPGLPVSDTGGLSRAMEAISLRTPRIPILRCSMYMLLTLGDSVPVMASWC